MVDDDIPNGPRQDGELHFRRRHADFRSHGPAGGDAEKTIALSGVGGRLDGSLVCFVGVLRQGENE